MPPKSRIQLNARPGALTASIPARGIFSVMGIPVLIGGIFLAVGVGVLCLMIFNAEHRRDPLGMIVFGLGFSLFGLAFFLIGCQLALKKTALVASADALVILSQSPLKKTETMCPRQSISNVTIGPSGVTVNNQRLNQLQIVAEGRTHGLMTGYTDEEIVWVVQELRTALKMKAPEEHAEQGASEN